MKQAATGKGNALEMNIPIEALPAQHLGASHQALHGLVGAADDTRAQEEAFDIVASVKLDGQRDDLFGGECSPGDVIAAAVDAVGAVVDADVGVKDLQ